MNGENQITEMARIMCETSNSDMSHDCKKCAFTGMCDIQNGAESLYEAEYREKSQINKEIGEKIYKLSEECGAGVMFWRKMRAYADELRGECE